MDLLTLVKAQGADDYVSPTIPFIPPTGTVTPTATPVGGPSISLETATLSLKKGEKATIRVVAFTDSKDVKAFAFKISYDKSLFKVIDGKTDTAGTQIPFSSSAFVQQANTVDENAGTITFKAVSNTATTLTNRVVAEFQVEGRVLGVGEIRLLPQGTELIDTNNTNILNATNGIIINVGTASVTVTPIRPSGTTPNTALTDDLGGLGSVVIGAFLMLSGIYLFRKKQHYDLQR